VSYYPREKANSQIAKYDAEIDTLRQAMERFKLLL